jgi:hypothetical protein
MLLDWDALGAKCHARLSKRHARAVARHARPILAA